MAHDPQPAWAVRALEHALNTFDVACIRLCEARADDAAGDLLNRGVELVLSWLREYDNAGLICLKTILEAELARIPQHITDTET